MARPLLGTGPHFMVATYAITNSRRYALKQEIKPSDDVEDEDETINPQKTEELEDGSRLEMWNLRRDRFDSQNNLISRFVLTTVGRVVMNYTIIDSVSGT